MSRVSVVLIAIVVAVAAVSWAQEDEQEWPKVITTDQGTLTVYQPQADSYEGDRLEARSAVSWSATGGGVPVFGAVWLSLRVEVDRDQRMVHVRELTVPQVRFPDADEAHQQQLAEYLERELPGWDLPLSLDRLIADLDLLGEASTAGLASDPPKIEYRQRPTVLVRIDGEPKLEPFDGPGGAKLERVVNTPFLIVRDPATGSLFLSGGGELWYVASRVLGPWSLAAAVPSAIAKLVEADAAAPAEGAPEEGADLPPPAILVVTVPAELVVSDGPPKWAPVEGTTDLLYMTNTESDVFLEISSQRYYGLFSGRWYRGLQIDDDWQLEYVPNDELPVAFAEIPEDSAVGEVLAHVAGTVQAREAVLDNAIPQTAAVQRDDASFEVSYDGAPEFEAIDGAKGGLAAAVNTPKSVFKLGSRYFSCEQGVWYEAASPTGPWRVCVAVPDEIYSIPPSSPHYNVTYVYVYDVTPKVVYVGYTPGYTGSYYSHGCVVYGTGWYYNPWYGPYYYPRPWTWGMRVHYDPWYGWSFGLSFSNGPFTFSFGHGGWGRPPYYGWWGPGGYRPGYRPYPPPGYVRPPYRPPPPGSRPPVGGTRPPQGPGGAVPRPATRPGGGDNLYARPANRDRLAAQPSTLDRRQPGVARDRSNDLLTDRSGNVYRKDPSGSWQQRDRGQWAPAEGLDRARPAQPSTRPAQPSTRPAPASPRPSQPSIGRPSGGAARPSLERDHSARQRGSARSQGYSGRSGAGRPGGGMPRGGGRRP